MKKFLTVLSSFSPVVLLAQTTPTVPTTTELGTAITAIGPVAGGAAAIGLSIWIYQRVKRKSGQAIN